MHTNRKQDGKALIIGNLMRLGEQREIAIYLRDGVTWVADFRGASGKLFAVAEWFVLNSGAAAPGGMERNSIEPLPACVAARIEQLHCAQKSEDPLALMVARLWGVVAEFSSALLGRGPAGALSPRMRLKAGSMGSR